MKRAPDFPHDTWELALEQASDGDTGLLVRFLRQTPGVDASATKVPAEVRMFLADVLARRVKIAARPGNRGKLDSWDRWIITKVVNGEDDKHARGNLIRDLAKSRGVTEGTIRDIVAQRRSYADK